MEHTELSLSLLDPLLTAMQLSVKRLEEEIFQ